MTIWDKTLLPHPDLDFFQSNHIPYYIVTPEWTQQSAGTRVTFQLCHTLNELGYEAYVVAQKPAANLRTPLLTPEIIARHKAQCRETIGIYTELMWGNTLETDIVVKWLLNREGVYSNVEHDDEALSFYFSPIYAQHEDDSILSISPVDRSIFNDIGAENNKRKGFAYFAHKYLREGKGKISDKLVSRGISLCKDIPRSHREIADILRSVRVLYAYEDTALVAEAALCGCPTIIVKTDFLTGFKRTLNPNCKELTEDEIDTDADITVQFPLKEDYENILKDTFRQISEFIIATQQAKCDYKRKDPLLNYCNAHKRIFIYGSGIFGEMVYNALNVKGIEIESFIVSDEHSDEGEHSYLGIPVHSLTWLKEHYNDDCGVVLAMTTANRKQVIPNLKAGNIKYLD